AVFDAGDWDRSVAQNAPGQSGHPGSAHFRDLAALWAAGQYFPLVFSDDAVQREAESTLTLVPSQSQQRSPSTPSSQSRPPSGDVTGRLKPAATYSALIVAISFHLMAVIAAERLT